MPTWVEDQVYTVTLYLGHEVNLRPWIRITIQMAECCECPGSSFASQTELAYARDVLNHLGMIISYQGQEEYFVSDKIGYIDINGQWNLFSS